MADQDIEVRRNQAPQASQGARTPGPMRRSGLDLFQSFRNEMDRMFDQFWRGFGLPSMRRSTEAESFWRGDGGFSIPAVDVAEDDKAYHITAELPGLSEKDIDVNLSGDMLTISGEKHDEREEKDKGKNYHFSERRYGSFRRSFVVPQGVDRDKIEASFKSGVLALTLPKTPEAVQQQKKIEVKAQQ